MKPKTLKCKNCKDRFTPFYNNSLQKFCMQKDECVTAQLELAKEKQKKKDKKSWDDRVKEAAPRLYPKKFKFNLQKEINKLARMIDERFEYHYCIDCGGSYGGQTDGGHFHSIGSNATLRYNLHNIHSQASNCNQNGMGGGKQLGYYKGLVKRYGEEYAELVGTGLQKQYTYIGLKDVEYPDKIALVRKLVRDFDTFVLHDSIQARTMFNKLINIYD